MPTMWTIIRMNAHFMRRPNGNVGFWCVLKQTLAKYEPNEWDMTEMRERKEERCVLPGFIGGLPSCRIILTGEQ